MCRPTRRATRRTGSCLRRAPSTSSGTSPTSAWSPPYKDAKGEDGGGRAKKKKIILGVVALGLIYPFVLAPKSKPAEDTLAAGVTTMPPEGEILPVPAMTLNLVPEEGETEAHFLRVGIALVLEEGVLASEIELEQARALDVAVDVPSSYTYTQARQPEFEQAVKEELSQRTREAFGDENVVRVSFTSFVVD